MKQFFSKILILFTVFIGPVLSSVPVSALTSKDLEDILNQHPYYDAEGGSSIGICGGTLSQATAAYNPISLSFPNFPDKAVLAQNINTFIKRWAPNSPWLRIPEVPDIGAWVIAESEARGINPLFIVAAGKVENGFGTSGDAPKQNNFFGMKGTTTTYRTFATPQEGMRTFMDAIQRNTQSSVSRYSAAKTIYEYFSIHQTGSIVYPGEPLDPRDADSKKGVTADLYDDAMDVWISWDSNKNRDNANPQRRGQYTPLIYYKINIYVINSITGQALPDEDPGRPEQSPTVGCAPAGSGVVSIDGYSFPLAPQTQAVKGVSVGQTLTTHHDKTPAFDLFSTDSADVYAIYGGTPTKINTNYYRRRCRRPELRPVD